MKKDALTHAGMAMAYIVTLAVVMFQGTQSLPKEDTIMAPIAMISLFTLSAAVMGYLFCYKPLALFIEGKKKQAMDLFLQTIAVFGVITAIALGLLFSGLL